MSTQPIKTITLPANLNDTQLRVCSEILIAAHKHPDRRCADVTRELWQAIIRYAEV